ncbi:MAG: hypothetical protein ACP5SG_06400 [Dissulfurimicrobium sp.]|uniref:hypothetical protein n=1 Tax=Dissulfurimicrobium sp. TaxID=2022436 RepID=UPI003D0A9A23
MRRPLLIAERKSDGAWVCLAVLRRGRRPVFGGIEEISGDAPARSGDIMLVLRSRRTYMLYDTFHRTQRRLFTLQINDRLRQAGLLLDGHGDIVHCARPVGMRHGQVLYSILGLPKEDLEPFLSLGFRQGVRLYVVTPAIAAISAFLKVLTPEPVLAACFFDSGLELIVAQNGIPVHLQFVPPAPEGRFGGTMLANTFDIVLQTVRRVHDVDIKKIVILGPNSHLCPETIGEYSIWVPDWGAFFNAGDPSLIPRYPELFGGLFIDRVFDFVPALWRISWHTQTVSQWAAAVAAVGAAVLWAAGLYIDKDINARLRFEMQGRKRIVVQERDVLQKMLPREQERDALQRFINLMAEYERQPRLDAMVSALTQAIPEGVSISALEIERMPLQTQDGVPRRPQVTQSGPAQAQTQGGVLQTMVGAGEDVQDFFKRPFDIKMSLVSSGDYGQCRDRFNGIVRAIQCSDLFAIRGSHWEYDEQEGLGRLHCLLLWKGGRS